MLFAAVALYFSISLYFAIDAGLKVHHDLTCPESEALTSDMTEILAQQGWRGKVAIYAVVCGLAVTMWPIIFLIKILVATKAKA